MVQRAVVVEVDEPLVVFADGFAEELAGQGYSAAVVLLHLGLLADLGRWLQAEKLGPAELTSEVADRFVTARREQGHVSLRSRKGFAPLLSYLRSVAAAPAAVAPVADTPVEFVLDAYVDYLVHERGLAASTVSCCRLYAQLFLSQLAEPACTDLMCLSVVDVTGFVLTQCRSHSVGWARNLTTDLRGFLRFLFLQGYVERDLTGAVPAVAGWRAAGLPKALPAGHVARLLDTCDRDRGVGKRDFAILTLLARVGLRAKEVAALEFGDIDWRAGEIVVCGKGGRRDRLPLPADVGEAIVDYLCHGRPCCASRSVFVRAVAPLTGVSARSIGGIVGTACGRAGFPPAGSHRLRHSAATEMLRQGASLPDIGQVLRQASTATTAIYAKVDLAALSMVARPWPEVGS